MLIVIHVMIALAGIGATGLTLLSPSRRKLRISYALIAGTIVSGTYLVWVSQGRILQACISGLIYLAITLSGVYLAAGKLSRIRDEA